MKTYAITDKAGRFVAGTRNTGVGTTLTLTDKQAEAALRNGEIVETEPSAETPFAVATITDTAVSPRSEVDSVPEATDPDAPAQPAGSATVEQAREAADEEGTPASSEKTAEAAQKAGEGGTTETPRRTGSAKKA